MTDAFSPIRVLLLDDQPEHGLMPLDPKSHERLVPRVPADIEDASFDPRWFDVRWLATPGEAREFRDLSAQLTLADPLALGSHGWVPDILVVDYMLTAEGRCRPVAERLSHKPDLIERASALAAVKALSGRLPVCLDRTGEEYEADIAGDENFGCFLGGLLLTTFFGHPCGLVASTVRQPAQVHGTYTGFFQWALHKEAQGGLRAGEKHATWHSILKQAVPRFRARLEHLARVGLVHIGLTELLELASTSPVDRKPLTLTATSRYGRRAYPVSALFIDGAETPWAWAHRLIAQARRDERILPDLTAGRELADALWSVYCGQRPDRRYRLSELLARRKYGVPPPVALTEKEEKELSLLVRRKESDGALTPDDQARLTSLNDRQVNRVTGPKPLTNEESDELLQLCTHFGMSSPDAPACGHWDADFTEHSRKCSMESKKWAVLMVIVRLLHARFYAQVAGRRLPENRTAWSDDLEAADVFYALNSSPRTPTILPLKGHSRTQDAAARWSGTIERDSGVKVQEVLAGEGLIEGERTLLRWYAESVEAERESVSRAYVRQHGGQSVILNWSADQWNRDPMARRVFFGQDGGA